MLQHSLTSGAVPTGGPGHAGDAAGTWLSKQGRSPYPYIDLRADRRFHVEVAGLLQYGGIPGAIYVITVLDISRFGMRTQSPVPLSAGLRVEVSACGSTISGTVRYCTPTDDCEFHIGIQADEPVNLLPFLQPIAQNL
jgi:hypothetical protein